MGLPLSTLQVAGIIEKHAKLCQVYCDLKGGTGMDMDTGIAQAPALVSAHKSCLEVEGDERVELLVTSFRIFAK